MTDAEPRGFAKLFGGIIKDALLDAFGRGIGAGPDDTREVKMGKLQAKVAGITKGAVVEGAQYALSDSEVQQAATENVSNLASGVVEDIKKDFHEILGSAKKAVETTDTRSDYDKMKSLLRADDGKWYEKLGKKVVAHAAAFALPILGYISGAVASRAVNQEDKSKAFGADFAEIYKHLLSRSTSATTTTA